LTKDYFILEEGSELFVRRKNKTGKSKITYCTDNEEECLYKEIR
jgi:hypothetical protein